MKCTFTDAEEAKNHIGRRDMTSSMATAEGCIYADNYIDKRANATEHGNKRNAASVAPGAARRLHPHAFITLRFAARCRRPSRTTYRAAHYKATYYRHFL